MQASLKYLALNINVEEKHTFDKEIKGIRAKLLGFKATCKDLEKLAYDVSVLKIWLPFSYVCFLVG